MSAVAEAAWPHCSHGNSGTDFTTAAAILPQAGPRSTVGLVLCDRVLPVSLLEHTSPPVQAHPSSMKCGHVPCPGCAAVADLQPQSSVLYLLPGHPYMSQGGDRELSPLFRLVCCSSGSVKQIPKLKTKLLVRSDPGPHPACLPFGFEHITAHPTALARPSEPARATTTSVGLSTGAQRLT